MKINVIGLGKLGLPIAACFAAAGHEVIGSDIDRNRMDRINRGECPVDEPGLAKLLSGNGRVTCKPIDLAVRESQLIFIVVPTPSKLDHTFSLDHIIEVCNEIAWPLGASGFAYASRARKTIIITSTVMPGATGGEIKTALERARARVGVDFGLVYSPEFVALGSVIRDFTNPDFILIGSSDETSSTWVKNAYLSVCQNKHTPAPVVETNWVNAEIAKLAINTYITHKITFANMLADVCETFPDANVDEVTRAMGMDSRIGPKYLKAGGPFGGPCFPRDVLAFSVTAPSPASTFPETVGILNEYFAMKIAAMVRRNAPPGSNVCVFGTSYKLGTVIEENSLGAFLQAELKGYWVVSSERPNVVVVALPTLRVEVDPSHPHVTVIDCWRANPHLRDLPNVNYIPVGVGMLGVGREDIRDATTTETGATQNNAAVREGEGNGEGNGRGDHAETSGAQVTPVANNEAAPTGN